MASFTCTALTLLFTSLALREGYGLPSPDPAAAVPASAGPAGHLRSRRCSCSSWEDRECIYFCHLDIIWVNTPSKILPFGLGSRPSRRRRRSAGRCRCLDPADAACSRLCSPSAARPNRALGSAGGLSRSLLETLRNVAAIQGRFSRLPGARVPDLSASSGGRTAVAHRKRPLSRSPR